MGKSLILNNIKDYLGFKKDLQFAEFLGIKQSTLSSWHKRGTINYELIIAKCEEIDANWLLTGKGEMLKSKNTLGNNDYILNLQKKHIEKLEQEIEYLKERLKNNP